MARASCSGINQPALQMVRRPRRRPRLLFNGFRRSRSSAVAFRARSCSARYDVRAWLSSLFAAFERVLLEQWPRVISDAAIEMETSSYLEETGLEAATRRHARNVSDSISSDLEWRKRDTRELSHSRYCRSASRTNVSQLWIRGRAAPGYPPGYSR